MSMEGNIWLSVILPSINYNGRLAFVESLYKNASSFDGIEIEIDTIKDTPIRAIERCIRRANTDWIWISNDDLICETPAWDITFHDAIESIPDGVAMFYPNDNIFGYKFPCFPLVRKDMIIDLFPSPFEKYKIDDSIRDVFPVDRRIHLDNVMMRHNRIYKSDQDANKRDCLRYISDEQMNLRDRIYRTNFEKINGFTSSQSKAS